MHLNCAINWQSTSQRQVDVLLVHRESTYNSNRQPRVEGLVGLLLQRYFKGKEGKAFATCVLLMHNSLSNR